MSEKKQSVGSLVAEYLESLDNSQIADEESRTKAIKDFETKYADRKFNHDTVRTYFYKKLPKVLEAKGISKTQIGLKKSLPKVRRFSDMETDVTRAPQAQTHRPQQPTQSPTMQNQQTGQQPAQPTMQEEIVNFEAEDVAALIAGIHIGIKALIPELDYLTEDEKKRLGNLWLPAAKRYLSDKWRIIGIPLLASLGIYAPKLTQARKKRQGKKKSLEELRKEYNLTDKEYEILQKITKQLEADKKKETKKE